VGLPEQVGCAGVGAGWAGGALPCWELGPVCTPTVVVPLPCCNWGLCARPPWWCPGLQAWQGLGGVGRAPFPAPPLPTGPPTPPSSTQVLPEIQQGGAGQRVRGQGEGPAGEGERGPQVGCGTQGPWWHKGTRGLQEGAAWWRGPGLVVCTQRGGWRVQRSLAMGAAPLVA